MQCCVPNCASNDLKTSESEKRGITYHEFPEDPQRRSLWLQALGLGNWRPNTESVVCSRHFTDQDFKQTLLCPPVIDVGDVPVRSEVLCRMCLCSDTKFYNIGDNDIAQQYEFLTASKDCVGDVLPQYICWECKARLASFARLRSVALRSLALLHEFYETLNNQETTQDVQLIIDRDANNLTTILTQSNTEIVDYTPKGEFIVFNVNPDNTVSSNLENRNDNSTNISKLNRKRRSAKVKNDNDNSDFIVNHHLENRTTVSKASNIEHENDNSDYDDENDNFDNLEDDTLETDVKDENECQKTDTDNNSGLEDMMYDSDSSKSEDDDIKDKVNSDLAKIAYLFSDRRLSLMKQDINSSTKNDNDKTIDDRRINKDIKDTFDIKKLSVDEQLKEFLQRKESDNYKNAGFKCDICYKGFIHEKAFNLHKIKHTDMNGPLKCPLCGVHYKVTSGLRHHIKESHQERYSCKKCDYVTGVLSNAKLHVDFHKGRIYKCPQCDKIFQKSTTWFNHIRVQHPSDIVCRLCGFSFVSENGLRSHTARKHKQKLDTIEVPEDGPRCVECNIQFSTDAALTTHYQESNKHKHLLPKNQSRKRRALYYSKAVYTNRPQVKQVSKNKGPVICEVCNIELPNLVKYRWHFKEHHPDQVRTNYSGTFMCELCGLFYSCQAVLEKHKESVHVTFEKLYSCDECGKKLTSKYSLDLHKETHLNKRTRFSCDVCNKTFCSYSNLRKHKILHKNLKFDCNICGKSFSHPQNRKNHITYVHNKKPLPERKNRVRVKKERKDSTELFEQ